jgi:uncharacterized protein (DUF58 family)
VPIPSRLLQGLAAFWLACGLVAALLPKALLFWQAVGVLFAILACADLWSARLRGCPIAARRVMGATWPVGVAQTVALLLSRTHATRRLRGRLFDHAPIAFAIEGMPGQFDLAQGDSRIQYRALANARGVQRFGPLEILLESPIRLWNVRHRLLVDAPQLIRVYPDFARIARYAFLATDHRLAQIGLLLRRRRGEGLEFQQLREYREGDALREIDWKASARHGKLISREYQDERNQQIVFLLDCGQRMHTRETDPEGVSWLEGARGGANLSHFDHTLNAMLLLCYVALRQGDGVGLSAFAHPEPRHFAPRRSLAALGALMETVYDLEPSALTPDYLTASRELMVRVRKRSLVVVLTNLRDEDEDTLIPALSMLAKRHLVMVASLREPGLLEIRKRPVEQFDDALAYAASSEYLAARLRSVARLRALGIDSLEVAPAQLPIALVNHYWRVKRSGRL